MKKLLALSLFLPVAFALAQATAIPTTDFCASQTLEGCIQSFGYGVANLIFIVVIVFAVIVLVWGSFMYLLDILGGKSGTELDAKRDFLRHTIVAVVIAILSWTVIRLIVYVVARFVRA